MRKIGIFTVVVFLMTLFLVTDSFAQREMRQKGSGGWEPENQAGRMYNPFTVDGHAKGWYNSSSD